MCICIMPVASATHPHISMQYLQFPQEIKKSNSASDSAISQPFCARAAINHQLYSPQARRIESPAAKKWRHGMAKGSTTIQTAKNMAISGGTEAKLLSMEACMRAATSHVPLYHSCSRKTGVMRIGLNTPMMDRTVIPNHNAPTSLNESDCARAPLLSAVVLSGAMVLWILSRIPYTCPLWLQLTIDEV
jgi:hypothetical protein